MHKQLFIVHKRFSNDLHCSAREVSNAFVYMNIPFNAKFAIALYGFHYDLRLWHRSRELTCVNTIAFMPLTLPRIHVYNSCINNWQTSLSLNVTLLTSQTLADSRLCRIRICQCQLMPRTLKRQAFT